MRNDETARNASPKLKIQEGGLCTRMNARRLKKVRKNNIMTTTYSDYDRLL